MCRCACAYADAVAPYDIFWLEEPLYWYLQPEDFKTLAARSPIPLANGEREMHRYTARDFIDSGAIRFIQFDSVRHMGFTEALRIAEHAALKNVIVAPHASPHYHGHLISMLGEALMPPNIWARSICIRSTTRSMRATTA